MVWTENQPIDGGLARSKAETHRVNDLYHRLYQADQDGTWFSTILHL
jgi:hypothetical protein